MWLSLRELRRRPGQFAIVGAALTLLTLLLLVLGALLDGLFLNSTGAIRANEVSHVVFSDDARQSFLRSTISPELRAEVLEIAPETGGLGFSLLGVKLPDEEDVVDGAVAGYELSSGTLPEPPPPGQAWADRRLESLGAQVGDTVLIGPAAIPLEIVGWVDDTNYLLQNGLWVEPDTWRSVQNANRPDAPVADGEFQALVVRDPSVVSVPFGDYVDGQTGRTETLTQDEAVQAIPGIPEQNATFTSIIGVTIFIAALVTALFFALLTIERQGLYAVLKAVGAPNRTILVGVVIQALVIALVAFALGALIAFGLSQILPPAVPAQFQLSRAITTFIAVLGAALVGSLVSFRRISRIAPAAALSAGT